jgi:hypothetical protein
MVVPRFDDRERVFGRRVRALNEHPPIKRWSFA